MLYCDEAFLTATSFMLCHTIFHQLASRSAADSAFARHRSLPRVSSDCVMAFRHPSSEESFASAQRAPQIVTSTLERSLRLITAVHLLTPAAADVKNLSVQI